MSYEPQHAKLVADPARPWKALVPAILGVLYAAIEGAQVAYSDNEWTTNDTFTVVLLGLAALTSYYVPNPLVPRSGALRNERGESYVGLAVGVLLVVILVVVLFRLL